MTRLRVLLTSTPDRGDVSVNPYTSLLERSLQPHCDVHRFTWPQALGGRYDVLHSHWPEHLIGNAQWLRRTVAQVLFAGLLVVIRVRRVAVVQTVHNVNSHRSPSRISNALLRRLDSQVDVRVHLHATDGADPHAVVFPHGDYRGWFADAPRTDARPGRFVHFGRVQPYKNVDGLLRAFAAIADPTLQLAIAGTVADAGLEREIRRLAADDGRVELQLRPLTDDELAPLVTGAEAVVLPYDYLFNSGVLLLALSLGRPVIVPSSELADGLADEVGPQWVARYEQPFDTEGLEAAMQDLRDSAHERVDHPLFNGRNWDEQAERLTDVYRAAVAARRG